MLLRTLLVIRHAKSSWEDASLSDVDRPLNERGKRDAPEMARRLLEKKILPDALLSSPAKRARKTAEIFLKSFDKEQSQLLLRSELYNAPPEIFFEVIESADDSWSTIALFAHNPGITDFANMLTSAIRIDNIPTCGIFAIRMELNKWSNFRKANKEFLFFDYPKAE